MENTVETQEIVETANTENEQEKTFTQEQVNQLISERVFREKAKYSDYDELKEKAAKLDESEKAKDSIEALRSELEKAKNQLAEISKTNSINEIRGKIAEETGVPINCITGENEDDCREQANAILGFIKSQKKYPNVKDSGEVVKVSTSAREQFGEFFNNSLRR